MSKATDILAGDILAGGRETLAHEAEALVRLKDSLGEEFVSAVQNLAQSSGRIIVTGIGKSGHIAHKIAATFASTGSLSQFVHAAEAAHGDLGMIDGNDIIIALSKSGKTKELAGIIDYAQLRDIPIIAITTEADSPLAEAADITLHLPQKEEACSMGLAPTTSTTMMLALGDALAIALLQSKGFSPENFRDFHPGGNLGKLLTRAADIMHSGEEMPIVPHNMKMRDAIIAMASRRFGCIGVTDHTQKFIGLVTDGDLRRNMEDGFLDKLCCEVMTENPYVVSPNEPINAILKVMNRKCFNVVFVVDKQKPIGVIHIHDILQARIA